MTIQEVVSCGHSVSHIVTAVMLITFHITLFKSYTPSGKKNINIVMNELMKSHKKCTCISNVLAFLSKPERSFTPQLDTVVIEVSLVKALRVKGNLWRLYRAKHFPYL